MENFKQLLNKNAIVFALILAGITILFDLVLYVFGVSSESKLRWITILFMLCFIIYGTFYLRNTHYNGFISYGQSFLSGFLIALYSAITIAVYTYIFLKFIDPGYIEKAKELALEKMQENPNLSEEMIEKAVAWQQKFLTPLFMSLGAIINNLLIGTIIALLASIFIKKEDKSFDAAFKDIDEEPKLDS